MSYERILILPAFLIACFPFAPMTIYMFANRADVSAVPGGILGPLVVTLVCVAMLTIVVRAVMIWVVDMIMIPIQGFAQMLTE